MLLLLLALALVIIAVSGGIYLSPLLWLVLIVALVVALFGYSGYGRRL